MIVPKYYEDLHVLHENTMPDRAYYIPASVVMHSLVHNREVSDRFQLLNGNWSFQYHNSIYDLDAPFYEEDYDTSSFDTIPVPSVWQNHGYDSHQYTNIRYPIPFDPPYVPQDNPCGAYTTEFQFKKVNEAPDTYLIFEGVDSCFYVWINGQYAGYSQVSHSTSEFDISSYLKDGRNRLAVLVLKWCDGTYLEDQDKFRMSGIFRDVYLLNRPKDIVFDYFVTTDIAAPICPESAAVTIRLNYRNHACPTEITILDAAGVPAARLPVTETSQTNDGYMASVTANICNPVLWSPEAPYLYTLVIKTENEVITDRIGIREIMVLDKTVCLNGRQIKFRGINRHDSDPVTGAAISLEQMITDLSMMKQNNCNAIRTSHYPNSPVFYQLCDEYGFMVIDEADLEAHGPVEFFYANHELDHQMSRWNETIAENPKFSEAISDRVKKCVKRDKNRPCVVIWSMGNESAYGINFEQILKWTKEYDPTRLTHYESAQYHKKNRKYDFSNIDLYSKMYPSFEEIQEYLEHDPDKPFLLCEYCHSMGNGPGDLEDYFQLFWQHDIMCGGFVWEWCDHGIYKGLTDQSNPIYYYGGDHGEAVHDINFCMDGMVYPDRTPHTGLYEYKNVHRPARVISYQQDTKELTLKNFMDFTDLKDYIYITYEMNCDGKILETGSIPIDSIPPHDTRTFLFQPEVPPKGKVFLKLYYHAASDSPFVHRNDILGFDEIRLENADGRNQTALQMLKPYFPIEQTISSPWKHWTDSKMEQQENLPIRKMEQKDIGQDDRTEQLNIRQDNRTEQLNIRQDSRTEQLNIRQDNRTEQQNIEHSERIIVIKTDTFFVLEGPVFRYQFDRRTGRFISLKYRQKEFLSRPMHVNIWRAPTDNDRNLKLEWMRAHYDWAEERAYETECQSDGREITILCRASLAAPTVQKIIDLETVWIIHMDGSITANIHAARNIEFPQLPRFGLRLFLPSELNHVTYYGYGPYESYIDKHQASSHGLYSDGVNNLHEDYLQPQENGSHFDCDYITVEGSSFGLHAVSRTPFSFNASPYTQEELTEKMHNFELQPCGNTVLCLDYRINGIGSNSCGPVLMEPYRLNEDILNFEITLKPFKNG